MKIKKETKDILIWLWIFWVIDTGTIPAARINNFFYYSWVLFPWGCSSTIIAEKIKIEKTIQIGAQKTKNIFFF